MPFEAYATLAILGLLVAILVTNKAPPDLAMMGALVLLMLVGAVPPEEGIQGFASRAVLMIASVYVLAAGLTETGATEVLMQRLLGHPKSLPAAQARMMLPVSLLSAFLNTTAVVAMYIPVVTGWARRLRISPSKLYMPLSFAAILGGTCTLIGTSSNITLLALFEGEFAQELAAGSLARPGFFWPAVLGVPAVLAGVLFVMLASGRLLPARRSATPNESGRRYRVAFAVEPGSLVADKTIEEAGLRRLPGLFLADLERDGDRLVAVDPETRLRVGDRLGFVGAIETVRDLRKIRGLVPVPTTELGGPTGARSLVEVVVSPFSGLIGRSIRDVRFRTVYGAAVLAVQRAGEHVPGRIGDIELEAGDALLLEAHPGFVDAHRRDNDLILVSAVRGANAPEPRNVAIALGILGLFVVLIAFTQVDRMVAAMLCAGLMLVTRRLGAGRARSSVNWQVLIVIAAALGIGRAVERTGLADQAAGLVLSLTEGLGPRGTLAILYLTTSLFAQLVTNNGAAVLMFPVAMRVAAEQGASPIPFFLTLIVASACSFLTPIAYQTNLMVYGPGGYRFTDYTRLGLPLTLIVCALTAFLAPVFFPL